MRCDRRRISSSVASRRSGRISSGWPTSRTSRPGRASCIWRSCSTSGVVASSAGAIEAHLRTGLVLQALQMATSQRRPPSVVIHHSDQGCQYTSIAFGKRCEQLGVRPSMGSVGDAYDNAMAESFFARLECELLDRSIARASRRSARRTSLYSSGSRAGTTCTGGTRRSAICRRSSLNGAPRRP